LGSQNALKTPLTTADFRTFLVDSRFFRPDNQNIMRRTVLLAMSLTFSLPGFSGCHKATSANDKLILAAVVAANQRQFRYSCDNGAGMCTDSYDSTADGSDCAPNGGTFATTRCSCDSVVGTCITPSMNYLYNGATYTASSANADCALRFGGWNSSCVP